MKLAGAFLLFLALSAAGFGKDLFVARAIPALTTGETVWRVEKARHGMVVRLTQPGRRFTAHLTPAESQALRAKIAGLRLCPEDIATLRARVVQKDGWVTLRPFDGVTYKFTISGGALIEVPNPSYDLEHHAELGETARLREVMDLLPELTRIAKKEKEQCSEPLSRFSLCLHGCLILSGCTGLVL